MAELWLEARNIKLEYADRTVLDIDALSVYEGDRIGLVGENGAGKSTLIKLLSGVIEPDAGYIRRLVPVGVIAQDDTGVDTPIEDMAVKAEFRAPDKASTLSGGEKTRIRIASAFSRGAMVLLADEPTSDLDCEGVKTITKRLLNWDGAFILVSHDRTLLDAVATSIWEIEDGRVTAYAGGFTDYRREKEQRRDFVRFEYEQYRAEKSRLIKSARAARERSSQVKKAPSRMGNSEARLHKREAQSSQAQLSKTASAITSRVERLEEKKRPREDADIVMRLGANSPVPGKLAVEARGINLGFDGRTLLHDAEIILPTGSRTALTGANGCGKTTLMNHIISRGDKVYVHPKVKLGVFDQDHTKSLNWDETALQNVMYSAVKDESDCRTVLARLGMRGDSVKKRVGVLSGGERAKVALARLLVSDANLLFLDEPTNHLDIFMLEALAGLLEKYEGTLMFISHDRWFVSRVATRTVSFCEGKLITREGAVFEEM